MKDPEVTKMEAEKLAAKKRGDLMRRYIANQMVDLEKHLLKLRTEYRKERFDLWRRIQVEIVLKENFDLAEECLRRTPNHRSVANHRNASTCTCSLRRYQNGEDSDETDEDF